MSEIPQLTVPPWTQADKLRKAREHARLSQAELADFIGIARSSVVSYESGRTVPSRPVLLSWALCTGVSVPWLADREHDSEGNLWKVTGKRDCLSGCAA